ncbi:DUF6479 family protein [Streptomyces bambusae]|uniref:DUF6479 family protein n=1 Tax=Streptomyces bambusae TaxID=1550616 RepID=UPI001CFD87D2|nr:DUF6479 family protein [Streptomyces bambusae]MCB5165128.1 DUF6479 family protein [Streptomyces bambusae]
MDTFVDIVWFLIVGIAVAGFLMLGFWLGQRVRDREPAPPAPESQPRLPDSGRTEICEDRDYVDIPEGGLRPHQLQGYGNFGSRSADGAAAEQPAAPVEPPGERRRFGPPPGRMKPA